MNIYDLSVKKRDGEDLLLNTLKGKIIIVVNTATGCGFTPQYEGLETLYEKYHDQGLEILDFPCNQFGHQAPGEDYEIHEFCIGKYKKTIHEHCLKAIIEKKLVPEHAVEAPLASNSIFGPCLLKSPKSLSCISDAPRTRSTQKTSSAKCSMQVLQPAIPPERRTTSS